MTDFDRRTILKGASAVSLAPILGSPALAQEAAATLEEITIETQGGQTVSAALAVPLTLPAPAIVVVHEWWGLNDQIKTMAAALAEAGYLALAVDLYDGVVATDAANAGFTMRNVNNDHALDTLVSHYDWLKEDERCSGKMGSIGWCFGGGWSLNIAMARPVDACVVYYGNVSRSSEQLAELRGPVLGHFGLRDTYINEDMVQGFQSEMAAAEKEASVFWYKADHAFANPTSARYDSEDAALAWQRTLDFLKTHLNWGADN